jgi:hypothetical protein
VWGEVEAPAGDDADRVERAVASGDEHAIKLVAACLGEFAHNPSPAYPAAVAQALDLVART